MNRRGRVDNIFNIDIAPPHSTQSSQNDVHSNDSRNPLTNSRQFEPLVHNGNPGPFSSQQFQTRNFPRSTSLNQMPLNSGTRSFREPIIPKIPPKLMRTISLDGQLLLAANSHAELQQLTENMRHDEHLMEDNPYAEQLRMDLLRALPHSLTIKRQIKSRLHEDISSNPQDHKINRMKRIKYALSIKYNQLKLSIKNTLSSVELWYHSLKTIEGHFGSSVAAYFKFLRWLFILNIFLLVITFGFITIPQILYNSFDDKMVFSETNRLYDLLNEGTETSTQNIEAPLNLTAASQSKSETSSNSDDFHFADLFTAEGFFKSSVLFYGGYSNATFSLSLPNKYSLPFAYFLTMLLLYIFTFITVSVSMARSYRKSFIESYGGAQNLYAHKVFCSWDFGISIEKAAVLKRNAIYNEIKEMLYDNNHPEDKLSKWSNLGTLLYHLIAHALVFAILGGLAVGTWYFLKDVFEKSEPTKLTPLYVSLFVNLTMFVINYLFDFISKLEEYKSPRTVVHIQLLRNFLLEAVIIGVLLVFWLTKSYTECWETSIGQEIYRIVIIDFFVATILTSILQCFRVTLYKRWPGIGLPEFDISKATLGLIFNQTLLWVGLLFSPLLVTIIVFKILLTFYIKKFCLMYFCKLPTKLWRAAQTQTLYLVMIFLSILGVIIVQGYIITQVSVSKQCGPFREYTFMFQILVDGILELKEGSMFWRIVMSITKPAVIGGILLTMCVVAYYLRAKSRARIAMVELLKDMLRLEGEDKEFLTSNINKAQEWFSEHGVPIVSRDSIQDPSTESSSTWKFNRPSTSAGNNARPSGLAASAQKRYSQLAAGSSRDSVNNYGPRPNTNNNGIRNRRY